MLITLHGTAVPWSVLSEITQFTCHSQVLYPQALFFISALFSIAVTHYVLAAPHFIYPEGWKPLSRFSAPWNEYRPPERITLVNVRRRR